MVRSCTCSGKHRTSRSVSGARRRHQYSGHGPIELFHAACREVQAGRISKDSRRFMPLFGPVVRTWFVTCLITVRGRMLSIGRVEHRSMSPRASPPSLLPQTLVLRIFRRQSWTDRTSLRRLQFCWRRSRRSARRVRPLRKFRRCFRPLRRRNTYCGNWEIGKFESAQFLN